MTTEFDPALRGLQLTQSELSTYQSLRARGYSHEDAIEDALDGVDVWEVRLNHD